MAACLIAQEWLKPKPGPGPIISLYLSQEKKTVTLPLEEYLVGVVLAEMPASFNLEALKAQAVCARTYTLYKAYSGNTHPGRAIVCDDIHHCQAYRHPGHSENNNLVRRVVRAVNQTRGEVVTYHGKPINAVYHSSCGGRTAAAEEVWGHPVPYLVSTVCSCNLCSPYRLTVRKLTKQEIAQIFNTGKTVDRTPVEVISRTSSGRARQLRVGERVISAAVFRQSLSLPSTALMIQQHQDQVVISCSGNGHGVGLCQYGAQTLATAGYDYRHILAHYYPGTELYRLQY